MMNEQKTYTHRFYVSSILGVLYVFLLYPKGNQINFNPIDLTMLQILQKAADYGAKNFDVLGKKNIQNVYFYNQEQGDKFLEYLEQRVVMATLCGDEPRLLYKI